MFKPKKTKQKQTRPLAVKVLVLTQKQIRSMISSLRSTSGLRSTERERMYLRKIIKQIEEQL